MKHEHIQSKKCRNKDRGLSSPSLIYSLPGYLCLLKCLLWKPPSSLDCVSPVRSIGDIAGWGAGNGGDTGSELGWDVGGGGGRGSGTTGDIFGVGERKRLKPALSACYKPAISRAEIWQSVNTASKTTRRNQPGTHLRWPLEGRKTSLKENKCFTVVF